MLCIRRGQCNGCWRGRGQIKSSSPVPGIRGHGSGFALALEQLRPHKQQAVMGWHRSSYTSCGQGLAPARSRSLPPHSPTNLGNPTRDIPQEFLAGRKPTPGSPTLAGSTHRRHLLRVAFPASMAVGCLPSSDALLLLLLLFRAAAVKTLTRAGGERGQLSASPVPAKLLPAVVPPPKKKNSGGAEEFETEGNSHFSPQISTRRRAESLAGARRGSQPAGLARCQKANTASAANI